MYVRYVRYVLPSVFSIRVFINVTRQDLRHFSPPEGAVTKVTNLGRKNNRTLRNKAWLTLRPQDPTIIQLTRTYNIIPHFLPHPLFINSHLRIHTFPATWLSRESTRSLQISVGTLTLQGGPAGILLLNLKPKQFAYMKRERPY